MSTAAATLDPVSGKASNYRLTGSLNFNTVPKLLQQGYDWLGENARVQIDLSAVTHAGSAGIGLLLEWLRQAQLRKTTIRFSNIPPALLEIARISDVADWLTD
ncbi:MAG TPA: STAS domain-containing protein [Gammaproteobacteria bacterium]